MLIYLTNDWGSFDDEMKNNVEESFDSSLKILFELLMHSPSIFSSVKFNESNKMFFELLKLFA